MLTSQFTGCAALCPGIAGPSPGTSLQYLVPSFSRPTGPQAPSCQLPEVSWGRPHFLCLLSSITVSLSACGTQPSMVARGQQVSGQSQAAHPVLAAFLVPNPSPPTPDLAASSGSFFALTTLVISRAGGLGGCWRSTVPPGPLSIQDRCSVPEPCLGGWIRAGCE